MEAPIDHTPPDANVAALEQRIAAAPHLVVEYVRLARILEARGELKAAAAAYQRAHFFLPNGTAIIESLRRLAEFVDTAPPPITISRPRTIETPEHVLEEESHPVPEVEEPPEPAIDEIDALIQGLQAGALGRGQSEEVVIEEELGQDDGLIATETLATIYASQNQFEEAMSVYNRLAAKETDPDKAAKLREKAAAMSARIKDASS